MESLRMITSTVTPLDRKNVDTDQIISKEFLKRIERTGFGRYLFHHWRFDAAGAVKESFVLNDPRFAGSEILLADENFGCGSSREHAPWAILDYGFRVILAPSYADIFYNNCFKNGILPIRLPQNVIDRLLADGQKTPLSLTVDLEQQTILRKDSGETIPFGIDPYSKEMLLNGWDEISLTFQYEDQIAAYENRKAN
ncbi:3-isopropylmalate dehydratase small subunit [Sporosarcina sp. NCCP-2716]|uniref:3-isopropylmalate dehydratase small subunit n=1 Tax=Sporosarcina sp. NCCP-2716 TaxID=2943679 RepID=UPI002040E97B|nr:3-isopropylmalate dehydratase small subunit [Sporosarcina sp. NCCP-2716]GKV69350.1 3-isopropylmalate dehydratase small subunit [Sporosarcina sp. NCCP-2716]